MARLVIKPFPDELHDQLKRTAVAHRRSVAQEALQLLESALDAQISASPQRPSAGGYWAARKVLPEYEATLNAGGFSDGVDSSQMISEERDLR
jgi:plasmid stability protein